MASVAEPTADCTADDLIRIYRENCALSTVDECNRALRSLRQLRLLRPKETEQSGDRMTFEEIKDAIQEADDALAVLQITSSRVQVITPSAFR